MKIWILCLCLSVAQLAHAGMQRIRINIPAYTLVLEEGDEILFSAPCYVGSRKHPTRTGYGTITDKRPSIRFFYTIGPQKGEVIETSYLEPEGRSIEMPYEDMKALGMDIRGHRDQVIHATTNYWKIGTASSHGCVGMLIEDMQQLYDLCHDEPLPQLLITYDTLEYDPASHSVTVLLDVYREGTTTASRLFQILEQHGVSTKGLDEDLVDHELAAINHRLAEREKWVKQSLAAGRQERQREGYFHDRFSLDSVSSQIVDRESEPEGRSR